MNVNDAVASRRSIRDFLPDPVPREVIERVLTRALRAPSGGNLQPWHLHVVGGEPLAALKAIMRRRSEEAPGGEPPDYGLYPRDLPSPYRDRRFQIGEEMYAKLGIPREDKPARLRWVARNFQLFGAPLALFCSVDRLMGPAQFADAGMLLQTVMLLLRAEGLDSCPQTSWTLYPRTLGEFLGLPADRLLLAGMAVGRANPEHPANQLVSTRAPLAEVAEFVGL
jgi:nitroreductase